MKKLNLLSLIVFIAILSTNLFAQGGGTYSLTSRISGKCVDVYNSSSANNADVVQWDCLDGANQQFEVTDAGGGYYYFKAEHSGKCLRAVNGNVVQYDCNNGWWSEMFESINAGDGYYILKNRGTQTCLRVENSSGSNGASIVLHDCNTGYWSEQFAFNSVDGGGSGSPAIDPTWTVGAKIFQDGGPGTFDDIAVKDPSIVYSGGRYHLFYTSRNSSAWGLGYASATTLSGLNNSSHTRLTSIGTGGGLAAPQIFWFGNKGRWFLIYQNGTTPSYSTNTDVGNPSGWTAAGSMGFADGGIDYWCIVEGSYVYIFYAANDGSHTAKRRRTTIANFPNGWGPATTIATDVFEGMCVYKNKADGKYYMVIEDMGATRWQELWTANSPGGSWTKVSEQWAHPNDLVHSGGQWTDQVSHVEVLRAGTNELMEVDDLGDCTMLFQGIPSGTSGSYASLPYDIGYMTNNGTRNARFEESEDISVANNILIHPNPVSNIITITLPGPDVANTVISVYNSNGGLVKNNIYLGENNNMDVSDLKPGLYLLTLQYNNEIITKKFIKE